ncbi:MAG TPA: YtcA family lipoprotein [Burkholderiaceae bacterium]|nr:YtcA family lipoprotein [Burkholderiaceae bacterium]
MLRLFAAVVPLAWVLSGCVSQRAPSIYLFGSYFPSWLLCAIIGIVGAALIRVLFIRIGLDDVLPLRLFVYVCIAIIITLLTSLLFFAH